MPTVDMKLPLKESSAKRIIKADLPTPESPARKGERSVDRVFVHAISHQGSACTDS